MSIANHPKVKAEENGKRVVIFGGGVGGLTAGIALKRQLGFYNFSLYEQSDGVGGTWHHNTYPGCASDIGTHWYSLSSDLNPNWDRSHVTQPDLLRYWRGLVDKYKLTSHIVLHTRVISADWNEEQQLYRIQVEDVRTGDKYVDYANAIISALGTLDIPHYPPEMEGLKTKFKGQHFHSSRWDHSVDLHNKRVAVIGNGSSSCQLIPIITEDSTVQVVNFCRTPNWILPDLRVRFSSVLKWMIKNIPYVTTLARIAVFVQHESLYLILFRSSGWMKKFLAFYLKSQTPSKYHDKIIPTHDPGCKRFVIDSGYLKALHRDNLDVTYDGIAEVTETGIVTKTGQSMDFDVIIQATGFATNELPIELHGIDGKSLRDYYRENGGPTAYRGTAAPGFPNFYTISGPNTITGHGSVIFTAELQTNYIIHFLQPIINGWASSFNVTNEATNAWNALIQKRVAASVFTACQSWYRVGQTGKVTRVWPGPIWTQWLWLRTPVWSHYTAAGGEEWERRQRRAKVMSLIRRCGLIALCVLVGMNWGAVRQHWAYTTDRIVSALV